MIGKRGNRYFVRINRGEGRNEWVGTFPRTREGLKEAKQAEAEALSRPDTAPTRMTGEQFADFWLDRYPRPRESTNAVNRAALVSFRERFGDRNVARITRVAAREWALGRPGPHSTVRAMFSDAVRDDLLPRNPFANLRLPQSRGRKDLKPISVDQLNKLGDAAVAHHGPIYGRSFRAMILFAAYVGLRPGELFALQWDDIEGNRVQIERSLSRQGELTLPKNGKTRTVVLPPPAAQALMDVLRVPDRPEVFLSKHGKPLSHTSHYAIWNPVRAAAGLNSMAFYELRHTCATHLLELGLSPADVATQLGHSDGGALVMSTYGHPSEDRARERIDTAFEDAAEMAELERRTG